MKRSPFFPNVAANHPTLVGVQGWQVANEFTTAEKEHQAVRERVGLFDWSTTGEFEVQGPDALALVQELIVNDASKMPIHRVLYTTILNEDGGRSVDYDAQYHPHPKGGLRCASRRPRRTEL